MPNQHGEPLATIVRSAREGRGWSRARLADEATRLGSVLIHEDLIMRLELRNTGIPEPEILRPLALALALDLEEVFARLGYF